MEPSWLADVCPPACLGVALARTREGLDDRVSWFFTGFLKMVIRTGASAHASAAAPGGGPVVQLVDEGVIRAFRCAERLGIDGAGRWLRHFESGGEQLVSSSDSQAVLPCFLEWLQVSGLSSVNPHTRIISCLLLSGIYWQGVAVPKDNDTAATWWYLATEHDFKFSEDALVSLVQQLPCDEDFSHATCCASFVPWIAAVARDSHLRESFQPVCPPSHLPASAQPIARGAGGGGQAGGQSQPPRDSHGSLAKAQTTAARSGGFVHHPRKQTPPVRMSSPSSAGTRSQQLQAQSQRSGPSPQARQSPKPSSSHPAQATSSQQRARAVPAASDAPTHCQYRAPSTMASGADRLFWRVKKARTSPLPCRTWSPSVGIGFSRGGGERPRQQEQEQQARGGSEVSSREPSRLQRNMSLGRIPTNWQRNIKFTQVNLLSSDPSPEEYNKARMLSAPTPRVIMKKLKQVDRHPRNGQLALFAAEDLPKGTELGWYTGVLKPRAKHRAEPSKYIYNLEGCELDIDAREYGNEFRFVSRWTPAVIQSVKTRGYILSPPNLEARTQLTSVPGVVLYTLEDIKEGEELIVQGAS